MEEKTFYTKEGNRIELNKPFNILIPVGDRNITITIMTSEISHLEKLAETGFITVETKKQDPKEAELQKELIEALLKKLPEGTEKEHLDTLMEIYEEINPTAFFQMLLKELAVIMDRKYEDHIRKCNSVYLFDLWRGKILHFPVTESMNFRTFSAFRTKEDIKEALHLLQPLLRRIYEK